MNTIEINELNKTKKIEINGEDLEIQPIGAGCEVGRSCIVLKFQNKKIMLDCGVHPAFNGTCSLPYFDLIDPGEIDLLLITHFHLDHCGALPYFLEKTNFKGECYMTYPTRDIYKIILSDYVKVSHSKAEESLYNETNIKNSMNKIKPLEYYQEIEYKGIKFSAFKAGHVLGAAMFLIEISGVKILYTGDYSRELDRHLQPAEIPNKEIHKINVLIVESTYGVHEHETREVREKNFIQYVEEVVSRGGKCLLPVFAIGRAQELLLILDEYWEANFSKYKDIPIYYASSLANDSIDIFKKYINMGGSYVKKKYFEERKNPFDFKFIKRVKTEQEILLDVSNNKPCVVFASPGMLQSGLSKNLFEKWCENEKNGIVITGYCVDKTLARKVLGTPKTIDLGNHVQKELLMSVKNVTFAAHSDFTHTDEFIQELEPKNIVLVHGEAKEMERLRSHLERKKIDNNKYKQFLPKIFNPQNCQKIILPFIIPKKGYIVGKLCQNLYDAYFKQKQNGSDLLNSYHFNINNINNNPKLLTNGMEIEEEKEKENSNKNDNMKDNDEIDENFVEVAGVLIDEENILLNSEEIENFSMYTIKKAKLKQILKVKFTLCDEILLNIFKDYFQFKQIGFNEYLICDQINLKIHKNNDVVLEWMSNGYSDFLVNSIGMIITQLENAPNLGIFHHYSNNESLCSFKKEKLINYLNTKYKKVLVNNEFLEIYDWMDEKAEIQIKGFEINCQNQKLKEKLEKDLELFKDL
jgi:cleavage and polyadenylation specificity factor subunit 3